MRGPDLARDHDRASDRLVLAPQVDRPPLPRPPVQAPVRLDRGSPGVRRPPALPRFLGSLGLLGRPDRVGAVQGEGEGLDRGSVTGGEYRRRVSEFGYYEFIFYLVPDH